MLQITESMSTMGAVAPTLPDFCTTFGGRCVRLRRHCTRDVRIICFPVSDSPISYTIFNRNGFRHSAPQWGGIRVPYRRGVGARRKAMEEGKSGGRGWSPTSLNDVCRQLQLCFFEVGV